jgi:polysaccharide biosynthesis transport protein
VDDTTLDLKDIIRTIKKQYRIILKIFAGFVIATLVISFLIPPTYEGETTLRIKQPKGLANSLLGDLPMGGAGNTKQLMFTYMEIMQSRTVVQQVIDRTQNSQEEVPTYEDMLKRITAQPVKDTEILKVKVTAKSPEEAQTVANVLVETFIERMTSLVREEQSTVRQFIGKRLEESQRDLEKAETQLKQYKQNEKIVAPSEETKAIIEQMSTITKMEAENEVALISAQAMLSSVDRQLATQKPGFIADSPLIQQYKGDLAEKEVQLVGLLEKYTDKHPHVIAKKAAIEETKSKLDLEINRIVNAEAPSANPVHQALVQNKLQSEAGIAIETAKKNAIEQMMAKSEKLLIQFPTKEQGLARVIRDRNVALEIYVMLAKRHEEARISEAMQPTEVQIIDVAIPPEEPIKPRKILNVVIAAILGLIAGIAWAFFLEYINKSIRNAEDVQTYLDLPVLGNIPDFDSKHKLVTQQSLWDKIRQRFSKNAGRSISR